MMEEDVFNVLPSSAKDILAQLRFQTFCEQSGGGNSDSDNDVALDNESDENDSDGANTGLNASRKRKSSDNNKDAKRAKINELESGVNVYQDNNVVISVKKIDHKKQTRYNLEDHLFELRIRALHADMTPPLVYSLEKGIRTALISVITTLQKIYDETQHREVYLTVCEKSILRGLNTGNYHLFMSSSDLAHQVLNILHSYLKSHENMRLSDSFKINAKILSVRHSTDLEIKRRKRQQRRINYGSKNSKRRGKDLKPRKQKWQINIGNIEGLKDMQNCLLQSLVISYHHWLSLEDQCNESNIYQKQKYNLLFGTKKQQFAAAMEINKEAIKLAAQIDVSYYGPHAFDAVAPKVCELWKCQINVFLKSTNKWHESYPPKADGSRRQLYLLASLSNEEISHVEPIDDIVAFYRKFGRHCVHCRQTYSGKSYIHFCHMAKTMSCYACHRFYLTDSTVLNKLEEQFYCKSKLEPTMNKKCDKCNMILKSADCEESHAKNICFRGFSCENCQVRVYVGSSKAIQDAKEKHKCFKRECVFCKEIKDENHLCKISKGKYPTEQGNLGFMQAEAIRYAISQCEDCFKKNETCSQCANMYSDPDDKPNLCILYYERQKRGVFDRVIFSDFLQEKVTKTKSHLNLNEELPMCIKHTPLSETRWRVRFGKSKKQTLKKDIFQESKDVISQMLNYIMDQDFRNYTILVHGGRSYEMNFIARVLLEHGVKPNILMQQQRINLIEIPDAGVRFLDAENYLGMDLFSLSQKHDVPLEFFPKRLNHQSYYNYLGKIPNESEWWEQGDTVEVKLSKQKFISQLAKTCSNSWSWNKGIVNYCDSKVVIVLTACVKFLQLCSMTQNVLQKEVCPENKSTTFLNPFNRPYTSKASYAFSLFKLTCSKDLDDIRTIKYEDRGIYMKSSSAELQWVTYMHYQKGYPDNFMFGFSPQGLKKCHQHPSESIPDYTFQNEAGFFHGCSVHRHRYINKECNFSKSMPEKMYGVCDEDVHAEDERKLQEFKNNHPEITNVVIIWQCEWNEMKKKNTDVKSFLEKEYLPWPNFRLNPRISGMCFKNFRMFQVLK